MRIAILGAGNVGGALATAMLAIGHSVVFGVRDPESDKCRRALAAAAIGFEPEDAGGLANAKPLEEMVRVWLSLTASHGRTVGFAISNG